MKIAKTIKQHLDTISGKRRLTILSTYVKNAYKEPEHVMRNAVGEYSPKEIIEQLRTVVAYVKNLCKKQGEDLTRYYSYAQIQEMETAFKALADRFEKVNKDTGRTTLRNLLSDSAESLEVIKPLLGPFLDFRLEDGVKNVTQEIASHQEDLQSIRDTAKEVKRQSGAVQRHYDKSKDANKTFEGLVSQTQSLQKQLEMQQLAAKEIHEKTKLVAKNMDKLQKRFEEKLESLDSLGENMTTMQSTIEGEYHIAIEKSREFEVVSARMEQVEGQVKGLLHQARHALNVSQGAGFLESYRDLYERASRTREFFPWAFGACIGFVASILVIAMSVVNVRALPDVLDIFQYPSILGVVALVPITVFAFFFCMLRLRKKKLLRNRYHSRYAALETYLRVSEQLPYDSPEQVRTASSIMRYLEEDFNPIAVRAMYGAHI